MYYTYVLISNDGRRTYTGCTNNLSRRLVEHNFGKVRSTKPFLPFEILLAEEFLTYQEARERERFYKTTSGRRKLKDFIRDWEIIKMESPPHPAQSGGGETSPKIA